MDRSLDAEPDLRGDWRLSALSPVHQPRRAGPSIFSLAPYSGAMTNPLANEWAIKHRSDVCTATNRPFAEGEYFYTLLFREPEGFRREDLSEQAWAARNENIQPFSFWRSRFEPAPPTPTEPLGKETAE